MKITILVFFLFIGLKNSFSQTASSVDSLLIIREKLINDNASTILIDTELIKHSYSPKVVVHKTGALFTFNYYMPINAQVIEKFKERLVNSFKIVNVTMNSQTMEGVVQFKSGADYTDMVEFFKAFNYDGIIYK